LYYDANGKGLDTKKKAVFYRVVTLDASGKPTGPVEDFYPNDKPMASGEASVVDKFDHTRSRWKGAVVTYNEKGKVSGHSNYDADGWLDGTQTLVNADGEKEQEQEYVHWNPARDYYLVYDKKGNTMRYSYLTHLPVKLATTDKVIVPVMERKVIYEDGQPVQFYFGDGLSVAVKLSTKQLYGDYYDRERDQPAVQF
jgi:antitoxin component YwqK of YwqJK toxin-antitoxin module